MFRQLTEESVESMAKTAETTGPDDRRTKAEFASHDHFSWRVLSVGTSCRDPTTGTPRVALREKG